MLFKCHECHHVTFHQVCPQCGPTSQDDNVPLDPEYFSEFQYRSQGIVRDLLLKRRTEKALDAKLNSVLEKYHRFERPYFVNFVHYEGSRGPDPDEALEYSKLTLFRNVLLRLGFEE